MSASSLSFIFILRSFSWINCNFLLYGSDINSVPVKTTWIGCLKSVGKSSLKLELIDKKYNISFKVKPVSAFVTFLTIVLASNEL